MIEEYPSKLAWPVDIICGKLPLITGTKDRRVTPRNFRVYLVARVYVSEASFIKGVPEEVHRYTIIH
jgi:hypothetical protein